MTTGLSPRKTRLAIGLCALAGLLLSERAPQWAWLPFSSTAGQAAAPQQLIQPGAPAATRFIQPAPPAAAPPVPVDPTETVYVVTTWEHATGLYHRAACEWLKPGPTLAYLRRDADQRYFQPHHDCMNGPTGRGATPSSAPSATSATPQRPAAIQPLATPPASPPPTRSAAPARTAPEPPPTRSTRIQCQATTRRGTQCLRLAEAGGRYCWQHK